MPMMSANQADAQAQARADAQAGQNAGAVQGLAAHVRSLWTVCRQAKEQTIEQRMLSNVRMRRGEYDPEELSRIREQGGSEIYMMVGSTKCRAAGSWLRDVVIAVKDEKPWTLAPTPVPSVSPVVAAQVKKLATEQVAQFIMATGVEPDPAKIRPMLETLRDQVLSQLKDEAQAKCDNMEDKMEDQLLEGGFLRAMNDFIDDLTTFPTAFLKGPIVRMKPKLSWQPGPDGSMTPQYRDDLVLEWERPSPFNIYPHPAMSDINDSLPLFERHRLTRMQITQMIGVEGYDEAAIRQVLDLYGRGGLHEWLRVDTAKALAEGRSTSHVWDGKDGMIDALQFFGPVQGKMLLEWGMTDVEIPDPLREYNCEVWLIGPWVIKATLNFDPLGRKPYYCTSYERVPGAFWGNSVLDLCRDSQRMCNAAARSLSNNMGLSSGPQVGVNVDRLPPGETVENMYPWKIWQFTDSPMANSTQKPLEFFQPQSNAQELMMIFQHYSVRADEDTGVPRYMTGESPTGGAGRTASGLSMLLGNASKTIKQVVSNLDVDVLTPLLERLYTWNMLYSDDPELKGDVAIVARGATSIMLKESAQVRRNEFLATVSQSPVLQQIVGPMGIAELLREAAKTLDMPNVDRIVPSPEAIRTQQMMQSMMQQAQAAGGPAPGPQGRPPGPANSGNQQLQNGAPATDNFSPPRQ